MQLRKSGGTINDAVVHLRRRGEALRPRLHLLLLGLDRGVLEALRARRRLLGPLLGLRVGEAVRAGLLLRGVLLVVPAALPLLPLAALLRLRRRRVLLSRQLHGNWTNFGHL